jgi:methyl-accepting chemotaxis protein
MKIRGKTVLVGLVSVIASIAITTLATLSLMRSELTTQAHAFQDTKMRLLRELVDQKGEPKVVDGKLQFGSYVANGNYEVVDKLVEIAGGTATLFLGDIRVSTNVKKDDGSRAVGTPLVGVAKDVTLGRLQPYRGEADILGVSYFTAYDPIIGADGRAFGVLYVGVKQEDFFRSFSSLIGTSIITASVLAMMFGVLIWYLAGRLLGRVSELAKTANTISVGDALDVPLHSDSDDEVGELTKAIDRLRESMRRALKRLDAA